MRAWNPVLSSASWHDYGVCRFFSGFESDSLGETRRKGRRPSTATAATEARRVQTPPAIRARLTRMEIKQQLKLSQQLVMTPQLQQAIRLLQLSRLELIDEIRKELDANPVLSDDEAEPRARAAQTS